MRRNCHRTPRLPVTILALLVMGCSPWILTPSAAQPPPTANAPPYMAVLVIPRVERAPRLEDFLNMQPSPEWRGKFAHLEGLVQRAPDYGQPASQRTEVYLGYDSENLYVIFVAFDSQPKQIRARLGRREDVLVDEDQVGFYLDTFHDQRRAYQFGSNAIGIQYDSTYSEDTGMIDDSFDTVWYSRGKLTSQGFVVWMSIPFKSLRFSHARSQQWGILVWRWLPRRSEGSWWPRASTQIRGQLSQSAATTGPEGISRGRNLQFIPYGTWRAFRAPDTRDPAQPVYARRRAEMNAGLDAKIVLKDSLVLDLTFSPDFSQVESDEPQSVVNQRFEVFFPEKRPFFTENASYFDVPIYGGEGNNRLLFTRRIADPQFGARLTGKLGPYSIGALIADDESLGKSVLRGDPLEGKRAYFGMFRLSRDLGHQSNVGTMYTERRVAGSYNRVMDLDGIFRLGKDWTATLLGAYSWTRTLAGSGSAGRDVEFRLYRQRRGFNYDVNYVERAPEFLTEAGYIFRNDLRYVNQDVYYQFWPQHSWFTKIMPELFMEKGWFFHGGNSFATLNPSLVVEVKHQTKLSAYLFKWNDALRPQDYPALTRSQTFDGERAYGFSISSSRLRLVTFNANYDWGPRLNYAPPAGEPPRLTYYTHAVAGFSVLTSHGLTISNSYILDRSISRADGRALYNSHIIRSKWNWQITRELSVRFIGQYNALLANPLLTSNPATRRFNADFLITYLVHPGTAVYLGYNSNLRRPGWPIGGPAEDRFVNDGRQLFLKVSYLFRF